MWVGAHFGSTVQWSGSSVRYGLIAAAAKDRLDEIVDIREIPDTVPVDIAGGLLSGERVDERIAVVEIEDAVGVGHRSGWGQ